MPRYIAFLRGVSPANARMPELKRCFEQAGFADVRTILSSGNVAFNSRAATAEALRRRAENAMQAELGRSFGTIVRPSQYLQELIDADPFAEFELAATAKRVVTFLRGSPKSLPPLPMERDGVRSLKVAGEEAFTAYERSEKGPVFMVLLEHAFGKDITTRTMDTIRKCARA